jgi:protein gp37
MATQTTIEWTEQTWNPTTGCTKISPGCKNCYAAVMARRLHAMGAPGYENEFELTVHPSRLSQPLHRKKPTVYFVNSMSDLFHEDVEDAFIDQVFSVIDRTPQHTYQILTKRAERLPAMGWTPPPLTASKCAKVEMCFSSTSTDGSVHDEDYYSRHRSG